MGENMSSGDTTATEDKSDINEKQGYNRNIKTKEGEKKLQKIKEAIASVVPLAHKNSSECFLALEENIDGGLERDNNNGLYSEEKQNPTMNYWDGKYFRLDFLKNAHNNSLNKVEYWEEAPKIDLEMDPFCLTSAYNCSKEPCRGKAFLLYKTKNRNPNLSKNTNEKESNNSVSSESSDEEPDITELVQMKKKDREAGKNVSGESYWYDEDRDVVRNLHKSSYSITTYGKQVDGNLFGKSQLQEILTPEERRMLQAKD